MKIRILAAVLKCDLGRSRSTDFEVSKRTQLAFDEQDPNNLLFYPGNRHPSPRPETFGLSNGWNDNFLRKYFRLRPNLLFLPPRVKKSTIDVECGVGCCVSPDDEEEFDDDIRSNDSDLMNRHFLADDSSSDDEF